jgi:O-antigen/teichoic acid export membrane protein
VIPGFVAAGLAETIILTIRQFALAALAGLAVVGALRASMLVFAPISVAHQGVSLIAAPEASRVRRRNPARFVPWLAGLSLSLTAGAALAAAVLVNMPDAVGVALLGENWWAAKPILVPQAVVMVVLVATNGPGTGLVVLGAARRLAYLTAWTKILGTGFVLVGGVTAAATGAAWASVGEQAVNLGALTRSFRSALREDAADSAPASSS